MSSIDNRVVQMGFENQKFESGIQTSIKSLDNLNKSLKLEGANKGMNELEKTSSRFNLAPLSSAIDTVAGRFSTMGIAGVTVISNLTNTAVNAGKRMISSLTLDPVKMGFNEYETKMNSIQTILTNTAHAGTTIDEVNDVLNELNTYADKTIYNFAEMTRNIGTFTAAGIDLKTSAEAIQGIANLAAGSGSNAQQASTAMYQLSQAMAAGTVKLQDWNSVVNAGMGGKLFQDALQQTAEELGQGRDMAVSFRDSLESGWITTEVLTKTLQKFANDESLTKAATEVKTFTQMMDTMKESVQSGWAQTWELIIGDKNEAAQLFTSISEAFNGIVGPAADARNEMLTFWKANGGRETLINALSSAFKNLGKLLSPIGKAFREVFPRMTGERLIEITNKVKELTDKFKISEPTINNLKRAFKGVFSIISVGVDLVKNIGKGFLDLLGVLSPVGGGFLEIAGNIGDFLTKISEAIKQSGLFKVIVEGAVNGVKFAFEGVSNAIGFVSEMIQRFVGVDTTGVEEVGEKVSKGFKPLETIGDIISSVFNGIKNIINKVVPIMLNFASAVGRVFKRIIEEVKIIFGGDGDGAMDVINGGLLAAILLGIRGFIKAIKDISENVGGIVEGITGILDGVQGSLEAYQNNLNAGALLKIAAAIGLLALSLVALSRLDGQDLLQSLGAITVLFVELFAFMVLFQKALGAKGLVGMFKASTAMILLATAVSILAGAVKKMSDIGWEGLIQGLIGVGGSMLILVQASKSMEKNSKGMIKTGIALIIFSQAINVLSKAVEKLGNIRIESLTKGLVAVGVLLGELALFMKATKLDSMSMFKAVGILILASAMTVMARAVERMGKLDLNQLGKGLLGVGALLTQLTIFMKLIGNPKGMITTSIGLTILGGALLIMARAVRLMGSLEPEVIGKGLITMAGALTIIGVAMRVMPKGIIGQAIGITILASALLIISNVVRRMGELDWPVITRGLVTMGGALLTIGLAMKLMKGGAGAAASLLLVAAGIRLLAPALERLGNMSLAKIGKGLLAVAGAFAVIGAAAFILTPVVPILAALAGVTILFGIAAAGVGAGLLAFSAGMGALAVSGVAGGAALVAIITGLIGLIPTFLVTIAEGLLQMIAVIASHTPEIVASFVKIVAGIIEGVVTLTPMVVAAFLQLITSILTTLSQNLPTLVAAAVQLVVSFLSGIASQIGNVIAAGIQIILSFINGIASQIGAIIDSAFNVIINFINGLADAIRKNHGAIRSAVWNLIKAIGDAIAGFMGSVKDIGVNIIKGIISGVGSMARSLAQSAMNVVRGAVNKVKDFLGINSPSRLFAEIGKFSAQGMSVGLDKYSGEVADSATAVGEGAYDSLKSSMGNITDAINGDMNMDPTIRPVLDLTNIQNGSKTMAGMLDGEYGVNTSLNSASGISRSMGAKQPPEALGAQTSNTTNTSSISNVFNISGTNAKEIADEVSRIIQKQVERRDVVWA